MPDEKRLRCFIALELSREAIDYIEELNSQIKKKNLFSGKFTDSENLHLTLKFLGEIGETRIEEIKKKLSKLKFKESEASLGEVGVFINKYNSILWIKLQGKQIWNLQKEIDKNMNELDFPAETRFMSHITIARMKKIFSKNELLDYVKNIKTKKIKFKIKEFYLKKSELKPEGPIYSNLEIFNLLN
jgi:2'-5' RNA ligase